MKRFSDWILRNIVAIIVTFIGIGVAVIIIVPIIFWAKGYSLMGQIIDVNATTAFGAVIAGLVTPFWTMAGVLIYYQTLMIQQKQINANQLNFEIQQFESKFFQLLNFQSELRNNLTLNIQSYNKLNTLSKKIESKDVFKYSLIELKNIAKVVRVISTENNLIGTDGEIEFYRNIYQINPENFKKISEISMWRKIYAIFIRKHFDCFGSYFNHFHTIIKYIDTSKARLINSQDNKTRIEDDRWKEYVSILLSQMSQNELAMLYYHSLLYKTHGQLFLISGLFDGLIKEKLIDPNHSNFLDGVKIYEFKDLIES